MTQEELKEIRKSLGLTQKELGNRIGISRGRVNSMENGALPISRRTELAVKNLKIAILAQND